MRASRLRLFLAMVVVSAAVATAAPTALLKTPVFEENLGQFDERVDYVVRAAGYMGFLSAGRLHLALEPAGKGDVVPVVVLEPEGIDPVEPQGEGRLAGSSHYLHGADPRSWVRGAGHLGRVRYPEVYPGIDLVYRSADGAVHYDFELAPGADPARIRLRVRGVDSLEVDAAGRLVAETVAGRLSQAPPVAFQLDGSGKRRRVDAAFVIADGTVGFELGEWDPTLPLVIDPPLEFSTFLGGTVEEIANDVAVDADGNIYVVGWTRSFDFPTTPGVYQGTKVGDAVRINLFLSKLTPGGDALVYSTYLGASSDVLGVGVAVDPFGRASVLAQAGPLSDLFTTANAVQSSVGTFTHSYVATFDAAGANLLYATFLTGFNGSTPGAIDVDSIGDLYVAGTATALGFPLLDGFQPTAGGGADAFFVKLNPIAATSLVYGTFLGGAGSDAAVGLAVDGGGRAYLTGRTQSFDFPVANAVQPTRGGGADAFATAIDPSVPDAASLIYSTYFGGSFDENGTVEDGDVAVDDLGWATYGATTVSSDLVTTPGTIQPAIAGSSDGFVFRLDPAGGLDFATYFGGSGLDQLKEVAIDDAGRIALMGVTLSADLPVLEAFQPARTNSADLFLSVLTPSASALVQSSFLGGGSGTGEHAAGVAFDGASIVAAGNADAGTATAPFPTTPSSLQPVNAGGFDAFVLRWPFLLPNQPPTAVADSYSVDEDGLLVAPAPGVLGNDSDPDGDPLTAVLETSTAQGMLALASDGSFSYTPDPDFNGTDGFTYTARDAEEASVPVTVTLTVQPVNDPPVAIADTAQALSGNAVLIDVLANDSDVDGDALTIVSVTQPAAGSVTASTLSLIYAAPPGFSGTESFTYTAGDGNGGTATATVTVTVLPVIVEVPVDMVPGKCPSGVKLQGGGRVKIAIAGHPGFDPSTVDLTTVNVLGLAPIQSSVRDLATPYSPFTGKSQPTDCNGLGADGLDDLDLRFDKRDLIAALEAAFGPLTSGDVLVVPLSGSLLPSAGGAQIVGEDVVVID